MTQAQLTLLRYNELATKLGLPIIGLRKKSKSLIESKIFEMETKLETQAAAKRIIQKGCDTKIKVSVEFADHLRTLMRSKVVPAQAFRQTLQAFPDTSRIIAKHSAAAAGMNPKTARNLFDRIRQESV